MSPHIFIVGLPGSGKSTVSKMLAHRLQCNNMEMDALIVAREGKSIPLIFDEQGENYFRDCEHEVLRTCIDSVEAAVVSTGGGVVVRADNRALLKAQPRVVYLQCSPQQLFERTRHDKNRPLLMQGARWETLQALIQEREPWYREVAKLTLSSENCSPASLVDDMLNWLEN